MRAPRTLQDRLALSALVVAAVWVVMLTTAFNLLLMRRLDAQAEDVLRTRAQAAQTQVTVRADGTLEISDDRDDAALDSGIWVFEGSTAVESATGPAPVQQGARDLAGTSGRVVHRDNPVPVAYYSLAIRVGARQVGTVVAAISLEPYKRSTRNTLVASVVLSALLLVLVFVLTRLVVARALAPVAEMTEQAREWARAGTALRFGDDERPGELAALAATLDSLLDRLSAVLRREQQLSAEISHELRTPLAGIIAETELFAARPRTSEEAVRAVAAVQASARRMESILETLLAAARAQSAPDLGRSDLADVLDSVVAATAGGPQSPAVTVEGAEGVSVGADGPLVERILSPLLENALRFARTAVHLTVLPGAAEVQVLVRDDGPGVPAGAEESIFEPGHRLAADEHPGAGLGLPLARRLARSIGGDVVLTGGAFVVTLPPA
ncbi:MAG: HAMP domain-containing sensor histidine kinase [Mycobacteriales bacterium]